MALGLAVQIGDSGLHNVALDGRVHRFLPGVSSAAHCKRMRSDCAVAASAASRKTVNMPTAAADSRLVRPVPPQQQAASGTIIG